MNDIAIEMSEEAPRPYSFGIILRRRDLDEALAALGKNFTRSRDTGARTVILQIYTTSLAIEAERAGKRRSFIIPGERAVGAEENLAGLVDVAHLHEVVDAFAADDVLHIEFFCYHNGKIHSIITRRLFTSCNFVIETNAEPSEAPEP